MTSKNEGIQALESLKIQFGFELFEDSGTLGVKPPMPEELIEKANNWFSENDKKIRETLNNDKRIRELAYSKKPRDQRAISALVLDALSGSFTGFPLATAATIIVHYYLDHYIEPKLKPERLDED